MALVFPTAPTVSQRYPVDPGTSGVSQWEWNGTTWNTVPVFVRTNNTTAYNSYVWPTTKAATAGFQLTDNLANGTLSWQIPGGPFIYLDDISSLFNGVTTLFQLKQSGVSYIPDPLTNVIIVLGGIIQTPGNSYTVDSFGQINFSQAPATSAVFVGISNLNC